MATGFRVLIVEDDPEISELIEMALRDLDVVAQTAGSAHEALAAARQNEPDLVTLDLSLPDGDGTDVCRELRTFSDAYVIMITSRNDEIDRLIGLDVGADDFLAKPFSPYELKARASALLRRPRLGGVPTATAHPAATASAADQESNQRTAVAGRLRLDPAERVVMLDGERLMLTPGERDLLTVLMTSPGRIWSREELCRATFPGEFVESGYLLDIQIAGLRRKIKVVDDSRSWITTIAGSAYTLNP